MNLRQWYEQTYQEPWREELLTWGFHTDVIFYQYDKYCEKHGLTPCYDVVFTDKKEETFHRKKGRNL